jgi:hypothetical protein
MSTNGEAEAGATKEPAERFFSPMRHPSAENASALRWWGAAMHRNWSRVPRQSAEVVDALWEHGKLAAEAALCLFVLGPILLLLSPALAWIPAIRTRTRYKRGLGLGYYRSCNPPAE